MLYCSSRWAFSDRAPVFSRTRALTWLCSSFTCSRQTHTRFRELNDFRLLLSESIHANRQFLLFCSEALHRLGELASSISRSMMVLRSSSVFLPDSASLALGDMLRQMCLLPLHFLFSELNVDQKLLDPGRQGSVLLIQGLDQVLLGEGENGCILSSGTGR
ncbi:hypothetical protein EYF80_012009 [Liparis tanakae]|uniref:Uncharacterized protein n=1 Tax=Liparis tanakae TaxID=230148 RepID=A0A4Z2IIX6_9TELE|nr:hypothetical protein EYF80_012009 [Liparis tanakae]